MIQPHCRDGSMLHSHLFIHDECGGSWRKDGAVEVKVVVRHALLCNTSRLQTNRWLGMLDVKAVSELCVFHCTPEDQQLVVTTGPHLKVQAVPCQLALADTVVIDVRILRSVVEVPSGHHHICLSTARHLVSIQPADAWQINKLPVQVPTTVMSLLVGDARKLAVQG